MRFVKLLIGFFICTWAGYAQVTVTARFKSLSSIVYLPDDIDQEDDLRFKHCFGGQSMPSDDCVKKLMSINFNNNTLGLNPMEITDTRYSASVQRYYQYWEEDSGNDCSKGSDDDLNMEGNVTWDLSTLPSGSWGTFYDNYSGIGQLVYYEMKFDMPVPVTPSNSVGVNIICGNTPINVSTNSLLPNDFDYNQIEYEWYINYNYDITPTAFVSYSSLTDASGQITLGDVSQRQKVALKVRTRYKGGEWSPFSASGSFDLYPAPPTISGISHTDVSCYGGISGSIELQGISNGLSGNRYTIAYTNKDSSIPFHVDKIGTASDISLPDLAYGHYQIIIKNGHGTGDSLSFAQGECHIVIEPNQDPDLFINQPASLPTITSASANPINGTEFNVSCAGNTFKNYLNVGSITITPQIGSGTVNLSNDYKYWAESGSFISSKQNNGIKGLPFEDYDIFIEDLNGCTQKYSSTIRIRRPPQDITLPGTNQNPNRTNNQYSISCHDGTNGILGVMVNDRGNVGTIQYKLYNSSDQYLTSASGVNGQLINFSGLREGAYKVTYIDDLGCTTTSGEFFLTNTTNGLYLNQPLKLEITTIQRPVEITNVTNYNNLYNGFDVSCSYNQDGYVNVVAQGGISFKNYTYAIEGGPGTQSTNVSSHFYDMHQKLPYTLRVTDNNGCTTVKGITLDRIPDTLKVQSLSKRIYNGFNVSCNEFNEKSIGPGGMDEDGSVSIVGIGGVYFKEYTYQYLSTQNTRITSTTIPGDFHSKIYNKLPWNLHEYQFSDANGCVLTGNFFLAQPSQLSVTGITKTQPYCYHFRDGMITITLAGGVYPQYESVFQQKKQDHTDSTGDKANQVFNTRSLTGDNMTIDSVDAGRYRIDVKDINGCTLHKDTIDMNEPTQISVNNKTGHVPCKDGGNGRFITTATGGTFPYTAWMNGTITGTGSPQITFTGLSNQDYSLIVTDAHGCNNFESLTAPGSNQGPVSIIAPPSKLEFSRIDLTPPKCFGYTDGKITPFWGGGYRMEANISYSLDSINYIVDSHAFENLTTGTYRLILQETNEGGICIVTTTVGLTQPQPLTITGTARDIACKNERNGMIMLTATGGNGSYLYSVSGENLRSNATFTGFDTGNYSATVKDSKHCPVNTLTFNIAEPTMLVGDFNAHFSTCGDANGSITFSGTGGTQPYSFRPLTYAGEITIAPTLSTMHQVPSGFHSAELKDAHQCTTTITGFVNDLNGPTVSGMLVKPASCSYSADGATKITIRALSASLYRTVWTSGDTVSKSQEANQLKGNQRYTVLTEDIYGCKGGDTVWVPAPEVLRVAVTGGKDPRCANEANGSLSAMASGGSLPYQYAWDDTQSQQTATATGLSAISDDTLRIKKYVVKTLDVKGCTATGTGSLYNPMGVVVTLTSYAGVICTGQAKTLNVSNPLHTRGNISYQWTGNNGYTSNNPKTVVSVAGTYTITVKDGSGCSADTSFALSTSSNLLQALYGATSHVSVGDTIILVEYSWPAPDSVAYMLPESFTMITASGDYMYTSVVPQKEGNYEISMKVALADCQDQLTKHIHVSARTSTGSNLKLGYEGITDAALYPNPAGEYSILTLTLTDEMPVAIQIRRAVGEDAVWQKTIDGKEKNEIRIDVSNFLSGVYVIYAFTDNSVRVVKLTVVR